MCTVFIWRLRSILDYAMDRPVPNPLGDPDGVTKHSGDAAIGDETTRLRAPGRG